MRLLNAYYGVRKLRNAQILGIIASAVSIPMLLLTQLDESRGLSVLLVLLALAVLGLSIAILVLELSGVSQASRDERSFHKAMKVLITGLVIGIVNGFIERFLGEDTPLDLILDLASDIVSLFALYYIIQSIARLAVRLKDLEMAEGGNRLFRLLLLLRCCALAISIASRFFPRSGSGSVLFPILICTNSLLSIVCTVLYLRYLLQTERLLLSRQIEQGPEPSGPVFGAAAE